MTAPTQGATNKTAAIVSDLGQMLNQELKLALPNTLTAAPLTAMFGALSYDNADFLAK